MGRHSSPTGRRLAPALVLGLTFISLGSPLGLIMMTQPVDEAEAEASISPQAALQLPTSTSASKPAIKEVASAAKTRVRQIPTSTPVPTVTTKPDRPSVEQRQVQRATTSTVTTKPTTTQPKTPSKAQIARQTTRATSTTSTTRAPTPVTTTKPSSTVVKTTTAPPTKTTTALPSSDPPKALAPSHQRLVQIAQKYVETGIPYRMGGNSLATGMDCSHFVWMVLKEAGYNTAYRPSDALAAWVTRTSAPQPGDLVLFRGHVGIFVGNGKMIDQGSSGGAHLREIKYYDNFIGYGRIPL